MHSDKRLPFVISATVIAVGALVLLGWAVHLPLLKSLHPTLAGMKVNTAVSFMLCGSSLWLLTPPDIAAFRRRLGHACARCDGAY